MVHFISEHFLPVKIHIKENPDACGRFGAWWTPTLLVMGSDGTEHHRIEGFLPADALLAQLALGLAKVPFARARYEEAQRRFEAVSREHPEETAAPEAIYWAGVAAYKATGKSEPLSEAAGRPAGEVPPERVDDQGQRVALLSPRRSLRPPAVSGARTAPPHGQAAGQR